MSENEEILKINNMDHFDVVRLWRFGGSEHIYFQTPVLFEALKVRLNYFGGITPAISKSVGWNK